MGLVWTPFEASSFGDRSDGFEFDSYSYGDPPPGIERVEFYVNSYDTPLRLADVLPRMKGLRVLQTQTAGVEHVLPHLPDGVTLCNARGVHDAATAEMAMTLMLSSIRGVPRFVRAQRDGAWLHDTSGPALADSRVLIVGHGSIGSALEHRLTGFECEVVRVARRPRPGVQTIDALPGLLGSADVVVILVPLTAETRAMVDSDFLAAMKDGALLVNLARGGVVHTDALLAETETGRLQAALDVTDPEPLPADHPLWRTPGVLISPHVGGGTAAMRPRITRLVGEQLRRYASGRPLLNVVS